VVLWTERFLRNLNEVENHYLKMTPDDPFYLDMLEKGIKICESDIKSQRARKMYEQKKALCEEQLLIGLKLLEEQERCTTDPLDQWRLQIEKGKLKQKYLESLLMALKDVAREFAVETYETPEVR
jgi:hypothetical protein